jgi:hypothetical protein
MRIGVDFDNTIAGYDRLFVDLALEQGIPGDPPLRGKRDVRDRIRETLGDDHWQRLQAQAYGRRMSEAELFDGVQGFFRTCRENGVPVHIVSHKTRFSNIDPNGVDLREAALVWMYEQGFFDRDRVGLSLDQVFFENTREEKVRRIAALSCSHFIDDLPEVFDEPEFPDDVSPLLFGGDDEETGRYGSFSHWHQITEHLFGNGA